jgi:hypothetical protein|tara:strand:+ start:1144 stop:1449 length:306 start_codon:yes stop_codon:yes gene_type:complete
MANKSIEKKSVGIDIDGDGIKDFTLDLKTIVMAFAGVISLVMTYTTLKEEIKINAIEIEVAKKMPPTQTHELINEKLLNLEDMLDKYDERLDKLEDKIYKR